jgi:tubulin polyglutamylase TTLL5
LLNTAYESMRYLDFRPYIDDIDQKLKTPKDLGYYYKMLGADCKLIKNTLEDNGLKEATTGNNFTLLWSSGAIKPEVYKNLKKYQKINHFPKSKEITRKDFLYKNICKLQSHLKANQKDFNFIPESFILPNEHKFLEESMEKDANCIWIIKPVASSQGKGIFVTNKIVDVI